MKYSSHIFETDSTKATITLYALVLQRTISFKTLIDGSA